ncbi:septal ring lytic transglycosylase RlpA family protein [Parasediminibacterium paludis]|uniref:Probable endolytic peptidoglycan transglycosylase RlpA n=1 Tax=Parasediminibacterium paludis TaxID=908966 RepID=A0ABV8PXH4_9BACT
MRLFFLIVIVFLFAGAAKCQTLDSAFNLNSVDKYQPITGKASFYSKNLNGTKTATGERYLNNKLTAASNQFKLNTWVRVTNISNGESVTVRINDRMHPKMAKRGRVIDLSRLAARKLDFIEKGITQVQVVQVDVIEDSITFLTKKYQNL